MAALRALRDDGRPKCRLELLAIRRLLRDFRDGHKRGLVWREPEAVRAEQFIRLLRHWKGEFHGKPFEPQPWQRELIIAPLFGWYRTDGTRRFRFAYVEVPRKNGKTTLAAAIALYALLADNEHGAEVYSVATKRDQAAIVFRDARNMLRGSPLAKYAEVFQSHLLGKMLNSRLTPLSADYNTLDGLNIHAAIIDEFHAHSSRQLFDVITTSTGARRQPFILAITTAGTDMLGVCAMEREHTIRVLEGAVQDDSHLGYVATIDKGDDWTKEKSWRKANPNFGVSIQKDYFETECKKALETPSYQNTFRRYHLDEWTQQAERWIDLQKWDRCPPPVADVGNAICYCACDLSSTIDLTSIAWVWALLDGTYQAMLEFWIPAENIEERERRDRVPYSVWARLGLVRTTPGDAVDYAFVRAQIRDEAVKYKPRQIAFDPYNATHLAQQLQDEDGLPVVFHRQGYISMNGPSKEFERLVTQGRIRHGGNPVLRWNVDCLSITSDPAGNIKPVKPSRQATGKRIDGAVALIMALGLALGQAGPKESVYEKRGLVVV
ncbi:MAG: terminase TerL endonuclease subunit [Patescibacteria group bacterium]